jgi:Fe-S cluster biogenesis protein NfuA
MLRLFKTPGGIRNGLSAARYGIRLFSFQTIPTPNPDALKFVSPECNIGPIENKTYEFNSTFQAQHSPLALKIFNLPGVTSVMIGWDFLTVNKQDYIHWSKLRPEVVEIVNKFLTEKVEPVISDELVEMSSDYDPNDTELIGMIKELIDTRIRPAIQDDGGDIDFRGFDEVSGTVYLKLQGACKSCSSSEVTLKHGIESMLMHYIEEVKNVEQILDPEEQIAIAEFDKLEQKLKAKASQSTPPTL